MPQGLRVQIPPVLLGKEVMATSKEVRSNIIALLRSNIGFGIEIFELLSVGQAEDGSFLVYDQRDATKSLYEGKEWQFKDVKDAVDKFLEIRDERKLGFDFEVFTPLEELLTHLENMIQGLDGDNLVLEGKIDKEIVQRAREAISQYGTDK